MRRPNACVCARNVYYERLTDGLTSGPFQWRFLLGTLIFYLVFIYADFNL